MKNLVYKICEDYSARVRLARGKLFAYGQQSNSSFFKMLFGKLIIGSKQYIYDDETDSVKELKA